MNCPHCGKPMKDGQVYCEICGKERQLVPIFETEVEERMETTISGIAEDLSNTKEIVPLSIEPEAESNAETDTDTKQKHAGINPEKYLIWGIIAVCAIVITSISFFLLSNHSSYEDNLKKAEEFYEKEDYTQVILYADKALEIAPNSSDAKMLIAEAYIATGKTEDAINMLEALISNDTGYGEAYEALIQLYQSNNNYSAIAGILSNCQVQSVLESYSDYLATSPEFSEAGGNYDSVISLKLIASGNGQIYYTTDGSVPTKYSNKYMTPIMLNSGIYTISAVYINSYGIVSDVVVEKYYIDAYSPDAPIVTPESGDYNTPQLITVDIPDEDCEVYYTTDQSEPSYESNLYTGPIPMPLGESNFSFIMYDENETPSDIAYYSYHFETDLTITADQAKNILIQALVSISYLNDFDGSVDGLEGRKDYEPDSVISVEENMFFLLHEVFEDNGGLRQRTGNDFAVNTVTGECFRISMEADGQYHLKEL